MQRISVLLILLLLVVFASLFAYKNFGKSEVNYQNQTEQMPEGTKTSLGFIIDVPTGWTIKENESNVLVWKEDPNAYIEIRTNSETLTTPVNRTSGESFEDWVKRFSRADTSFADSTPMRIESEFTVIDSGEIVEKRTYYNSEYGPGPWIYYKLYIEVNDSVIKNYTFSTPEKNKHLLDEVKKFIKAPVKSS